MEKHAGQIMTKNLITINIGDNLTKAYCVMQDHKIRHLPVLGEDGDVVGILSDRDLQRAMMPMVENNNAADLTFEFDPEFTVKDFMSWPVHAVMEDVSVRDVALRMLNEKLSAMMVMSLDRVPRGIVTTDDLLKLLIKLLDKDPSRLKLGLNALIDDFTGVSNWS